MKKSVLFIISAIILSACVKKEVENKAEIPTVEVFSINAVEIENISRYPAVVVAPRRVISAPFQATVGEICVREGTKVAMNDLVIKLSSQQVVSAYNTASATLYQAQDAYDRLKIVHSTNSVPEVKLIDLETQLSKAQAAEASARAALDDCKQKAPIKGIVDEINVKVGEEVKIGSPMAVIVDIDNFEIEVDIPENEIANLQIGDTTVISIDAINSKILGKIARKSVVGSKLSHSYRCSIEPLERVKNLSAGMLCEAQIVRAQPDSIEVPSSIIKFDDKGRYVWVAVPDGGAYVAEKRYVTTGDFTTTGIIIKQGLQPNDKCIVRGAERISTGVKVDICEK